MGIYLNPMTTDFQESLNSKIYIDKSLLIRETNACVGTEQKLMCVSRPRRFGKSMAMKMLSAYYSDGTDSHALFDRLKISKDPSYNKHINKYNVVKINIQQFVSMTDSVDEMLGLLQRRLVDDMKKIYPSSTKESLLGLAMSDIYSETKKKFVILIDEWDCLFREYKEDQEAQKKYLDFLRNWLKDQDYVALAYMTGILPIKKYGTHSALNMFTEYSMTNPRSLAPFFGFTEEEVQELCAEYKMSVEEARSWYDGYELIDNGIDGDNIYRMHSPKSMVDAMLAHKYDTYWNRTETYEALKVYIELNMDGLKDKIIRMMAGERVKVSTGTFVNDMTTFARADDVLTLLVHLGYLTYHADDGTVSIPNNEVAMEYVNAVSTGGWDEVAKSIEASRKLLRCLWEGDGEAVALGVDQAHNVISVLKYNDENSLSCCVHMAFYCARDYYTVIRELPAGRGFADIVLIPRVIHADKPAVVIELKKDCSVGGAIDQIKDKHYCDSLQNYHGNLLLCGINYDSRTKQHSCIIEKQEK